LGPAHPERVDEDPVTGTLGHLALAALVFVASHVGLSSQRSRDWLVGRLGRRVFLVVYSALAIGALVWLVAAYADAPVVALWPQAGWTRYVPLAVMPLSAILLVAGLGTANATVLSDGRLPEGVDPAPGILKVTRHPVMWAIIIWAAVHIPPSGDVAGLLFFGAILALAVWGPVLLDAKHARTLGDAWKPFAAVTSVVPFWAALQGRNRVSLSEIGWAKIAAGLALYAAFLFTHEWITGLSALPI
jgi:uncharacterized membrane protein